MQDHSITILGLGEAGTALAQGFASESGWHGKHADGTLLAIDTALQSTTAGAKIRAAAARIPLPVTANYDQRLSASNVVFSATTGVEAMNAARTARPFLKPGTLYLDINTLTGKEAAAIGAYLSEASVTYIDVGVVGIFHSFGYKAPMLIAGDNSETVAAWMTELGFSVTRLEGPAGTASAVKILRSIMMKGLEALTIECLVAAKAQNLVEPLLAAVGDVDQMGYANFVTRLLQTHLVHGKRRHEEVAKVLENLRDIGMEPTMSSATYASLGRSVAAGLPDPGGDVPALDAALERLRKDLYGLA